MARQAGMSRYGRPAGLTRRRALQVTALGSANAFALAILGCGGGSDDKGSQAGSSATQGVSVPSGGQAAAAGTPQGPPTGKVTFAYDSNAVFENANPLEYYDGGQDNYRFAVADYLLHWADNDAPAETVVVPGLAQAMPESSPDKLTWTFKIRPGAKFHDGTPVTSEDVKYSWELSLDPKFRHVRRPEITLGLDKIETPDAQTAVFKLKNVWWDLIDRNPQWAIISKAHTEKVGLEAVGNGNVVAAGPFKLTRFEKTQAFDLTAVEGHYRKTPYIKDLQYRKVAEPATRVAQLATGEADLTNIMPDLIPELEKVRGVRINKFPHSSNNMLVFKDIRSVPQGQSPFHDRRVREAMSLAIDRKTIVEKIYGGVYELSGSISTKWTPGYDASIPVNPYNVDKAKALLKEAGYENGLETTFHSLAVPPNLAIEPMIDMWKRINVKVNLNLLDGATWNAITQDKTKTGMYIQGTAGQLSGSGYLTFLQKDGRYSHYLDQAMEDMVTKLVTESDRPKRDEIWKQIQRKVADDMVYATLWQTTALIAVGPRIKVWNPRRGVVLGYSNYEHLQLA